MKITNPPAGHDQLSGVSAADHHTKYTDANARAAVVEDAGYGAGWNADTTHAPSQNAVYDAIEALHAAPSDTAYASSWNGVTAIAPSKNAVYDKIEALHAAPSDTAYASSWNGVTAIAPSKNAVYDKIEALPLGSMTLLSTAEADDDSYLDMTGCDTAKYGAYMVVMKGMLPTNSNANMRMQLGDSSGIDTSGSDYGWVAWHWLTTHTIQFDENDGSIQLSYYQDMGNGSDDGYSGVAMVYTGTSGGTHGITAATMVTAYGMTNKGNYFLGSAHGTGWRRAALTLTTIRIYTSGGNLNQGVVSLYGLAE